MKQHASIHHCKQLNPPYEANHHKQHTHLCTIASVSYLSTCRGCKSLLCCLYAYVTHPMTSGNAEAENKRASVGQHLTGLSRGAHKYTDLLQPCGEKRSFPFSDSRPKQTQRTNRAGGMHWTHILRLSQRMSNYLINILYHVSGFPNR